MLHSSSQAHKLTVIEAAQQIYCCSKWNNEEKPWKRPKGRDNKLFTQTFVSFSSVKKWTGPQKNIFPWLVKLLQVSLINLRSYICAQCNIRRHQFQPTHSATILTEHLQGPHSLQLHIVLNLSHSSHDWRCFCFFGRAFGTYESFSPRRRRSQGCGSLMMSSRLNVVGFTVCGKGCMCCFSPLVDTFSFDWGFQTNFSLMQEQSAFTYQCIHRSLGKRKKKNTSPLPDERFSISSSDLC